MAQKANLTPVDKYEPDGREAERFDLKKRALLEGGLIDPVSAIQPAPSQWIIDGWILGRRDRGSASRRPTGAGLGLS